MVNGLESKFFVGSTFWVDKTAERFKFLSVEHLWDKSFLGLGHYFLCTKVLEVKNFMGQIFYGFQFLGAQTFWGPSCFGGKDICGIKILG